MASGSDGHHGSGRSVGQGLQHDRRAQGGVAVRAGQATLAAPVLPPLHCVVQPAVELLRCRRVGRRRINRCRLGGDERKAHPLALAHAEHGLEVVVVDAVQLDVARHDQGVVAADGAVQTRTVAADPGLDLAVVEAGDDVQPQFNPPADPLDDAKKLAVWVLGSAASHREAVVEPALAVDRAERRLQHERPVDVCTQRWLTQLGRRDRAVPAVLPVENPAEAAAGVEAPRTCPIDRAHAGHQGHRVAVADEGVVPDRGIRVAQLVGRFTPLPTGKSTG